jgi:hypothetical protein
MATKYIIGLDGSAACVAWAILNDRREIVAISHGIIGDRPTIDARQIARWIKIHARHCHRPEITWAIETNDFPKQIKTKKGIHSFRVCRWAEGRVLQALGIDNPMGVQASSKDKAKRRAKMEAKYADELQKQELWYTNASKSHRLCLRGRNRLSLLTEDEIDALAVADAAATKVLVESLA